MCVADFWETEQRRGISTFTSPVKVDKLLLVTTTKPLNSDAMFQFPDTFISDRLVPPSPESSGGVSEIESESESENKS
jgi:hypothetical protein